MSFSLQKAPPARGPTVLNAHDLMAQLPNLLNPHPAGPAQAPKPLTRTVVRVTVDDVIQSEADASQKRMLGHAQAPDETPRQTCRLSRSNPLINIGSADEGNEVVVKQPVVEPQHCLITVVLPSPVNAGSVTVQARTDDATIGVGVEPLGPFDLGTATRDSPLVLPFPNEPVIWQLGLSKASYPEAGLYARVEMCLKPLDFPDCFYRKKMAGGGLNEGLWEVSKFKQSFKSKHHIVVNEEDAVETQRQVIKALRGASPGDRTRPAAMKEIELLKYVAEHREEDSRHPSHNVINILWTNAPRPGSFDRIPATLVFSTSLGEGGPIRLHFGNPALLEVENNRRLTGNIISGLLWLHSLDIAHRDLKPDNVVITSPDVNKGNALIIDLGVAVKGRQLVTGRAGTRSYHSPEARKDLNQPRDPFKGDYFALGLLIYHMIGSKLQTDHETGEKRIILPNGDLAMLSGAETLEHLWEAGKTCSPHNESGARAWVSLLWDMLRVLSRKRRVPDDIYKHPFFTGIYEGAELLVEGEVPVDDEEEEVHSGQTDPVKPEEPPKKKDSRSHAPKDLASRLEEIVPGALESVRQTTDAALRASAIDKPPIKTKGGSVDAPPKAVPALPHASEHAEDGSPAPAIAGGSAVPVQQLMNEPGPSSYRMKLRKRKRDEIQEEGEKEEEERGNAPKSRHKKKKPVAPEAKPQGGRKPPANPRRAKGRR